MGLPLYAQGVAADPRAPGEASPSHPRHRMESSGETVHALPTAECARQESQRGGHSDRTGVGGLHVGNRTAGAAARGVLNMKEVSGSRERRGPGEGATLVVVKRPQGPSCIV